MTGPSATDSSRRRLLGALGIGVTTSIAGCLGELVDNGAEGEDDDEHPFADRVIDHPGGESIPFTEDQHCAVCNMRPTSYARWQGQLAHENGEGAVFDTPGCLFAYYAAPPVESPVSDAWTTNFGTTELIDATDAHFVLVTDEDGVDSEPMGLNPRPFAAREDAVAYLDEWDAEALTEEDIIELSAVDREIARIYRGRRVPDEP
ncbi:nitrous oxide reductase accessory protein NosL [Natrialba asiatica]|uniref:nitrous oxide reductase accessory protein NosL n=1 Tax=Natrialba asiatica TaxID=64602 RepID=UPI0006777694|nr:nitrous oxide reductase accessory protein NosL [Natrialba asiatica]